MKIYRFYEDEVHSLEVEEKKKTYIAEKDGGLPFGCKKMFYKYENWPTTIKDLITNEYMECHNREAVLEKAAKKINDKRKVLYKLAKENK